MADVAEISIRSRYIPRALAPKRPVFAQSAYDGKAERDPGAFTWTIKLHSHDLEPQQVLQYRGEANRTAKKDFERGMVAVIRGHPRSVRFTPPSE